MVTRLLYALEVRDSSSWRLGFIAGRPAIFTAKAKARTSVAVQRRLGTKARVVAYTRGQPVAARGARP